MGKPKLKYGGNNKMDYKGVMLEAVDDIFLCLDGLQIAGFWGETITNLQISWKMVNCLPC
jgi:hypothetical protein